MANSLTGADSPDVGQTLTERTHYAHVRYAASETAFVIWFDPRDGREKYVFGSEADIDGVGDETQISVKIQPHRPANFGTPGERYFTEVIVARRERCNTDRDGHEEYVDTRTYARTEVHGSLAEAREWCREHIDGYAEAPRRNAVTERTDLEIEPENNEAESKTNETGDAVEQAQLGGAR